ncbi:MAG: hypothetical protein FJ276_32220, partial [Planctomycetes bacterium]|nr:hypothetical protein [Planctomycetota bacterium]
MAHKPGTMSWDNIRRRAGGRRGYNSRRHFLAVQRRRQVARLLLEIGMARGYQRRLARELSVSPVTICKDIAALFGRPASPDYARTQAWRDFYERANRHGETQQAACP